MIIVCTTPDGMTYVGEDPPPGCEVKAEFERVEPKPTIVDQPRGTTGERVRLSPVGALDPAVVFLVAAIVVVAIIAMIFASKSSASVGDDNDWPFYLKRPLTRPEQVLYFRLRQALPDHIVLAQVQLSRFLGVKRGHGFRSWNNRVDRLSADFVICEKDATVVVAIELDDKSHDAWHRQEADAKKTKALASAGVRLVRWQARALPDEEAIRREVLAPAAGPSGGEGVSRPDVPSA